jgi:hypothetical protein
MKILRNPLAVNDLPEGLARTLLTERFAQLAEFEPYDPDEHGYYILVEVGDTVAALEEQSGCRILSSCRNDAKFGDADFSPDWECLELHPSEDGSTCCVEMVFIVSDSGYGVVFIIPVLDGVAPELIEVCDDFLPFP